MRVHGLVLALSIVLAACSDDPVEPKDTVSFAT